MARVGEHRSRSLGEKALQIYGVLGAPIAWAAEFTVSYMTTQHACSTGAFWLLKVLSLVSLLIALTAVAVAFRTYQSAPKTVPQDSGTGVGRSLFMGVLGLMVSTFFTLAILAEAVPRFILTPCD